MARSSKRCDDACRRVRTLDIFTITSRMLATASFSRWFSADKASRSSWSLNRGEQRYSYTFVRAHTFSLSVTLHAVVATHRLFSATNPSLCAVKTRHCSVVVLPASRCALASAERPAEPEVDLEADSPLCSAPTQKTWHAQM